MKRHWISRIVIALAALHLALLMAYSFPDRIVPEQLRVIAQSYVRPFFHQQWRLFAPDPPLCSCAIEWLDGEQWRSIEGTADHYLERRIAQNLGRYAQADRAGEKRSRSLLIEAIERLIGRENVELRLREECVIDAQRPAEREMRITPIGS